jgi:opacity protein-like surface antigen
VHQFSGNVKVFGGSGSVRPFINGGGGAYHFDGGDTRGGANLGGGLQFNLTPTFAIEGAYNFHTVFTPGSNVKFSTLQGGVRFRF